MHTDAADARDYIYVCRLHRPSLPATAAVDAAAENAELHDLLLGSRKRTIRNRIKSLDLAGVEYHRVKPFVTRLRGCIAEGHPFVFHHATHGPVVVTGYDDAAQTITGRNSQGSVTVAYPEVSDPSTAADFWTIRPVDPARPKVQVTPHDPAHPARLRTEWRNYRDPATGLRTKEGPA